MKKLLLSLTILCALSFSATSQEKYSWKQTEGSQDVKVSAPDQSNATIKHAIPVDLFGYTSETYCHWSDANVNAYASSWKKKVPYGVDTSVYFYMGLCYEGDDIYVCPCVDLGTCVPLNIENK